MFQDTKNYTVVWRVHIITCLTFIYNYTDAIRRIQTRNTFPRILRFSFFFFFSYSDTLKTELFFHVESVSLDRLISTLVYDKYRACKVLFINFSYTPLKGVCCPQCTADTFRLLFYRTHKYYYARNDHDLCTKIVLSITS